MFSEIVAAGFTLRMVCERVVLLSGRRIVLQILNQRLKLSLSLSAGVDDGMAEVFDDIVSGDFGVDWIVCRSVRTASGVPHRPGECNLAHAGSGSRIAAGHHFVVERFFIRAQVSHRIDEAASFLLVIKFLSR